MTEGTQGRTASNSGRRWLAAAISAALAVSAIGPSSAQATFHLMSIREVYPGSAAAPGAEYVELQMYAAGQNFVQGHSVNFYGAGGAPLGSDAFPQNVPNGQSQRTVLMGTAAAESQFGVAVDAPMTPERLDPAGGAVCWSGLDCVSWGAFGGALPSPAGAPAGAIPTEMALRRTIARSCSTLLEAADDTGSSVADFFDAFPEPRPNSAPPAEFACLSPTAGAGGGASGGETPSPRHLQTKIVTRPRRVTTDRTPTFRFRSNRARARFQCSVDRRRFRACRSPFTVRRLQRGCHRFRVRARAGGAVDRSPASFRFRVVGRAGRRPRRARCRGRRMRRSAQPRHGRRAGP
jgi:hypothetical protein